MNGIDTYLFLDTMIYLHFSPLEDIPFTKLFNLQKIIIVFPRVTASELDKHKNTHESQRIRDRASARLNLIHNIWTGASSKIRDGVLLEYYPGPSEFDYALHGLDSRCNDDILLASILQFKQNHAGCRAVLITDDIGPKFTARHLGIECDSLDEKFRLPQEEDPILKENKKLRNELLQFKSAMPCLLVGFHGLEDEQKHIVHKLNPLKEKPIQNKDEIIKKLRADFPPLTPSSAISPNMSESLPDIAKSIANMSFNSIPESEFTRYNKEVDLFVSKYSIYIDLYTDYHSKLIIKLELDVRNIGRAPADDVDLYIHFPEGFSMYTNESFPVQPKPPKPPIKPRKRNQIVLDQFQFSGDIASILQNSLTLIPELFSLEQKNGFELKDHFDRLKHNLTFPIRPLYIVFPSYEETHSFHFKYVLSAANIPQSVIGQLNVVIEK